MELVQSFRVWTAITVGIFWGLLGIIFGSLWDKFVRPEEPRLTTRVTRTTEPGPKK